METATEDRQTFKLDPDKVQVGDHMAFINWVRIKAIRSQDEIVATNVDTDKDIVFKGRELVVEAFSADQVLHTVRVSKTAAAEILVSSFNRPIGVSFTKTDGSNRVMKCRLIKPEALLGRSMVEDLEQPAGGNRTRLVDHRTLDWVVVDGVKYVVR